MPASKHFFEGYCRAKDLLHTIATKISEATIIRPWTIKSEGRIIDTNAQHSTRAEYHDKYHVCLKRELDNGDIINLFIIDNWNTPTNNIWGNLRASICDYDSFVAAEGRISYTLLDRWLDFQYYTTNQVADTEAAPQMVWYWIWVDNECIILHVFGNAGGAGTATPTRGTLYFGKAPSLLEEFEDTWAINIPTRVYVRNSRMLDYVYPNMAPLTWSNDPNWPCTAGIMLRITTNANPDINGKIIARIPSIYQQQGGSDYYGYEEHIPTHRLGTGQYLVTPIGASGMLQSDIVSIDELNADYINTQGKTTTWSNATDLALIKRMESAYSLTATASTNNVDLIWHNPKLCYGVKIVRKVDSAPGTHDDGEIIFNLNSDTGLLIDQTQAFTDTTCETGHHYYYRAFAYDSNNTYSVPVTSAQADVQL